MVSGITLVNPQVRLSIFAETVSLLLIPIVLPILSTNRDNNNSHIFVLMPVYKNIILKILPGINFRARIILCRTMLNEVNYNISTKKGTRSTGKVSDYE